MLYIYISMFVYIVLYHAIMCGMYGTYSPVWSWYVFICQLCISPWIPWLPHHGPQASLISITDNAESAQATWESWGVGPSAATDTPSWQVQDLSS